MTNHQTHEFELVPAVQETDNRSDLAYQISSSITNTAYLRLTVFALLAALAAVIYSNHKLASAYTGPVIVRVNEIGRAEALGTIALTYKPQEPEIRYTLIRWATIYYQRKRSTIKADFGDAVQFLEANKLYSQIVTPDKLKTIAEFANGQGGGEISVFVRNVIPHMQPGSSFWAEIDLDKISDDTKEKHRFTVTVYFHFVTTIQNAMIPVNPLGFTIDSIQENEVFLDQTTK